MKKVELRRISTEEKGQKNLILNKSTSSLSKKLNPLKRRPSVITSTPKKMVVVSVWLCSEFIPRQVTYISFYLKMYKLYFTFLKQCKIAIINCTVTKLLQPKLSRGMYRTCLYVIILAGSVLAIMCK